MPVPVGVKRIQAVLGKSNAASAATEPIEMNVVPSREYAHVPVPVTPVTAMPPTTAPLSASVMVVVPVPLLMNAAKAIVSGELRCAVPREGEAATSWGALLTVSDNAEEAALARFTELVRLPTLTAWFSSVSVAVIE